MARYVLTADTTLDGLTYPRGTIVNAPHDISTVVANSATLAGVPRARAAGIVYYPAYYLPIPAADQLPVNVEPVLPTANSQYD